MTAWQVDFYRRPVQNEDGQSLWEWVACEVDGTLRAIAWCPQNQVNAAWLAAQIQEAAQGTLPELMQVFRPQSLSLIEEACSSRVRVTSS